MKERPILFSAPMVRAILDGSKAQTRRIVKPQPTVTEQRLRELGAWVDGMKLSEQVNEAWQHGFVDVRCPYGQPGDRLWVREAHAQVFEVDIPAGRPFGPVGTAGSPARPEWKSRYVYRADGEMPNVQWHHVGDSQPVRWTPSIHMPRRASRITLEVTGVRVERLQDISVSDCIAEGIARGGPENPDGIERREYRALWEQINGPGSWEANPWVWVVEFRRLAGERQGT